MDLKDIKALIELLEGSSVTELRYRSADEDILVKRGQPPASGHAPQPVPAPARSHAEMLPAATETLEPGVEIISSPIVGTFYRAPSLDSEPFVREGQEVDKGHTLCILEAMKLMNQFEAEFACTIVRIIPTNGALVEYGSPLFEVRRR